MGGFLELTQVISGKEHAIGLGAHRDAPPTETDEPDQQLVQTFREITSEQTIEGLSVVVAGSHQPPIVDDKGVVGFSMKKHFGGVAPLPYHEPSEKEHRLESKQKRSKSLSNQEPTSRPVKARIPNHQRSD